MAKKIVRGITDVKTINNQDYDTNNVNDLLSDGQYNYIHRKKGETEEYHNLTDNIKTLSSDNTELLSVTNNNKTTNTATLHPKHDAQKEQVLESTRNTVTINHGTNGTAEKTTVDTNPQKVLEHVNLLTDYGISKTTTENTTKLGLEYTKVEDGFDLNDLSNGCIRGNNMLNAPYTNTSFFVEAFSQPEFTVQIAYHMGKNIPKFHRFKANGVWEPWRQQVGDKSVIDNLLAQKEQVLESTRDTVTIHHGANGTAEKTTVDTNPLKVLEHENLISDSEYITLNHQQGENTTHIQTAALEEVLLELYQSISASGGTTSSIQKYYTDGAFSALKHVVTNGNDTMVTFTLSCDPKSGLQMNITGDLKYDLEPFVLADNTVSNGAISIKNDGTSMKLINSAYSEEEGHYQQGTFTFYDGNVGS